MSGICGIVRLDRGPVSRDELERMAQRAVYRGPHGIEYYCRGSVGVACLSLDTTPDGTGACRPVVTEAGRVVLAADVRLDNRSECIAEAAMQRDLPEGLHAPGATPRDAEVMLAVLARFEESGPARMLGDFAYALWDDRRRELRLARDAMGMRALYFRVEPTRVLFASELKQILAADGVPRKLNETAVAWHLAGMQTPPGNAFYQGIEDLRPGEEVTVGHDGQLRRRVFWEPNPAHRIRYRNEQDYREHMRELLVESVRCRLRARSPVGISLSGGMDSASVASVAGLLRERGENLPALRAYCWAFSDLPECDERENSARVTNRYGITSSDIPAEETWPLIAYPDHGPHEDDPFFGMYQAFIERGLSMAQADGVSTMLYGDRGDLICGGDVNDLPGLLGAGRFADGHAELNAIAREAGRSRSAIVKRDLIRPIVLQSIPRPLLRSLRAANARAAGTSSGAAAHVRAGFLKQAGLPERSPVETQADYWRSPAQRRRYLHVFAPLVMRVATWTERTCAAFGIGFVSPWSDRRIAEFVLAIPQHILHRVGEPKRLLRRAMHGIMPAQAIAAAVKTNHAPLYDGALRERAYRTVTELLTDTHVGRLGFIDERALKGAFERFVHRKGPSVDIWPTLALEWWLRRYWFTSAG